MNPFDLIVTDGIEQVTVGKFFFFCWLQKAVSGCIVALLYGIVGGGFCCDILPDAINVHGYHWIAYPILYEKGQACQTSVLLVGAFGGWRPVLARSGCVCIRQRFRVQWV